MCIAKSELETRVQNLRNLKTMKEELENEIKHIENEIIDYMKENKLETEITASAKITYKSQSRVALDKKSLVEILGDDLKSYEKTTYYNVLRIK